MENITVRYLGHSAALVETKDTVFIFDYANNPVSNEKNMLDQGYVDFNYFSDKKVYVFFSHSHGDHFSRTFLNEGLKYKNVKFILGDINFADKSAFCMQSRQSLLIDDIEVITGASRDAGVCFLVKSGNLQIIHLGDNANWEGGDLSVNFKDEIDFLNNNTPKTDILFNPCCDFDGYMYDMLVEGALYAIDKLKPKYFMPIHANGREYLFAEFKKIYEKSCTGIDCPQMLLPLKAGDKFEISNTV